MARRLLAVVVAVALVAMACDAGGGSSPAGGGDIVVTTPLLADLVRSIVGDSLSVRSLVPAGADPHAFRMSELDLRAIDGADLVVVNGAGFEADLDLVVEHAVERDREVVVAVRHLAQPVLTPAGATDPHFWHDPFQMEALARVVGERLGEVDPGRARAHRAAARALARDYRELAGEMEALLSPVPERRRALVTPHDFMRYFAQRFDFDVPGTIAPGLSSLDQPTAEARQSIVETIDQRGLCAVFTPSSSAETLVQSVADEAETEVDVVRIFGDTLPDEQTGYRDAMVENARRISSALTGCG